MAYSTLGNVTKSAAAAEITPRSHQLWMHDDVEYAGEFNRAQEIYTESLEAEADRRAKEGVRKYKFHQGNHIMTRCAVDDPECVVVTTTDEGHEIGLRPYYEHEYSDTLLIFRLKALRPEVYRERHEYTTPQSELDEEITRRLAKVANRGKAPLPGTTGGGNGRSERNGRNGHAT